MKGRVLTLAISVFLISPVISQSWVDGRYSVEYDTTLKIPRRVTWDLCSDDIGEVKRTSSMKFYPDADFHGGTADPSDYTRTGYDRGHMCPAADRSSSRHAMMATFSMANITPQAPALNRGAWKRIEDATRRYARGGYPVTVMADAIFWQADTLRIGRSKIAVPHAFVKTVRLQANDSIIYSGYFQNDNL